MGLREALHVGRERPKDDPNTPHAFRAPGAHWVESGVPPASLAGSESGAAAAIGTGLEFGDRHCAICRRPPDDPLHFPVQD